WYSPVCCGESREQLCIRRVTVDDTSLDNQAGHWPCWLASSLVCGGWGRCRGFRQGRYFLSTALTSRVGSTCMGFWSSVERPIFTHGNRCLACMETTRIS